MRSLFFRIFLSFWLATVLIGASLVVVALTSDPRRADFAPHEERLARLGGDLVSAYESGGAPALRELLLARKHPGRHAEFLFRGGLGPLSGLRAPPIAGRLASRVAATGERESRRTRHGLWLALPLGGGYVILAEVPPPSPLERLFDPYGLSLRLGVAFAIIGLLSFLLARSLAAPIRELRRATQQLAEGNLGARVGPALGRRRDETAELGRDFDRMAERIEALLASQQRLLRDISHELRSPLARLNVALALARQKSAPEVDASLDRIEREAERLNDLIGRLLTLAVLETGGKTAEDAAVDLAALVRDVAHDADFEAHSRSREVRLLGIADGVWTRGSPELLRSAVENVIRNAVRFTAAHSAVEVRLSLLEEDPGPVARIAIRDHGPGVPEDSLEKLFEPFYRVADARDRQSGGTGIGLAIAERAVRLHGGSVRAANAQGGGLAVTMDLPARPPGGGGPGPGEAARAPSGES